MLVVTLAKGGAPALGRRQVAVLTMLYVVVLLGLTLGTAAIIFSLRFVLLIAFGLALASRISASLVRNERTDLPNFLSASFLSFACFFAIHLFLPNTAPLNLFVDGLVTGNSASSTQSYKIVFERLSQVGANLGRESTNLRHTISFGLAIAVPFELLRDDISSRKRTVRIATALVCVGLLQTRSAWMMFVVFAVPFVAAHFRRRRALRTGRINKPLLVLTLGTVVTLAFLLRAGLVQRLAGSGDESTSVRRAAFSSSLDAILAATPFPPPSLGSETSPHNLILQVALDGGIFAGLFATAMVLTIFTVAIRSLRLYTTSRSPLAFASWSLLSFAIVRFFTSGNSLQEPQVWVSLFLGLVLHEIERHSTPEILPLRAEQPRKATLSHSDGSR